jgi:hypothetical protein
MGASYVRTQDSRKNKRFMLTVKKTKKIFSFLHRTQKCSLLPENLCVDIPTPQGVTRECSLSGAGARFGISKEVGG